MNKEKSAEDNRVTYITLTEKGKSLRPVFFYISKKLNKVAYGGLLDAEVESLETMLQKIHDGFPPGDLVLFSRFFLFFPGTLSWLLIIK